MKLYYAKGACSLAVRILIHELNVPCDYEAVNLQTKKTETGADFLQTNPKGAVPTLELDNGQILTENAAIQQYLADAFHAKKLLPPLDDFNRYRVLEWLNFISTDLHKGCGPLFNGAVPQELKDSIFKPLLANKLTYTDQQLKEKKYLLGDEFTIADGYLFVVLSWIPHFGFSLSQWSNLSRFYDDVKGRPAVQKALQEEGLKK